MGGINRKTRTHKSQTLHVCHICLHWGGFGGQCRHIFRHGVYGNWKVPILLELGTGVRKLIICRSFRQSMNNHEHESVSRRHCDTVKIHCPSLLLWYVCTVAHSVTINSPGRTGRTSESSRNPNQLHEPLGPPGHRSIPTDLEVASIKREGQIQSTKRLWLLLIANIAPNSKASFAPFRSVTSRSVRFAMPVESSVRSFLFLVERCHFPLVLFLCF